MKTGSSGFDWASAMAQAADDGPPDPLAIRGRGFFLMRLGCQRVTWNEAGNEVSLWFTDDRGTRAGV